MAGAGSSTVRAEILLDLAFAEYRSGAFGGSLAHCAQAADLAEAEQHWALLARAALLVDGVSPPDSEYSSVPLCRRALALLPDTQPSIRAQLEARLAYAAADDGDLDRAAVMSADALALAESTDDPAALLAALRARHQALAGPGYASERLDLGARAIELAGRGDPLAALWGRLWRIDASFESGDLVELDRELSALSQLAEDLRFPLARWHLLRLRAARESWLGRFATANEHARAARDLAGELDDPSVLALYYAFVLFVSYTRGTALAEHVAPGEVSGFIEMASRIRLPIALASAAMAMVTLGDLDEAARVARQLYSEVGGWPKDGRWIVTVPILADVVADLRDQEGADVLYPLLEPYAGLVVAGGSGAVARDGSVSRHLGRLAATSGRLDVAQRHLRDAIAFEQGVGASPFAALSQMYLADVLQAQAGTQNLTAAGRLARAALATMRAIDMPGRAGQCAQILAVIEADIADRTALTPRESEIVTLVAEGQSNRQIAEQLFVSERTVETHVSHVLAKLGASTRTDITTWAVSGGLRAEQR